MDLLMEFKQAHREELVRRIRKGGRLLGLEPVELNDKSTDELKGYLQKLRAQYNKAGACVVGKMPEATTIPEFTIEDNTQESTAILQCKQAEAKLRILGYEYTWTLRHHLTGSGYLDDADIAVLQDYLDELSYMGDERIALKEDSRVDIPSLDDVNTDILYELKPLSKAKGIGWV